MPAGFTRSNLGLRHTNVAGAIHEPQMPRSARLPSLLGQEAALFSVKRVLPRAPSSPTELIAAISTTCSLDSAGSGITTCLG